MCRMIAKVSSSDDSIMEEMFLCPTSLHYLSRQGRQPDAPWERGAHNDGCGLAFVKNGIVEIHKRDKDHAWDSSYQSVVKNARSKIFIAHNRLASKGLNTSIDSAHPFFYQPGKIPYAFSHNGSVKTYMDEAKQSGTSDSKILLQKIVHEKEKHPKTGLADIVTAIAIETDYNSLSAFLMTADELNVWKIYNDRNHDQVRVYEDYYTLYLSLRNGNAIVSSEPLDESNWQLLPNKSFLTLKPSINGIEIIYRQLSI